MFTKTKRFFYILKNFEKILEKEKDAKEKERKYFVLKQDISLEREKLNVKKAELEELENDLKEYQNKITLDEKTTSYLKLEFDKDLRVSIQTVVNPEIGESLISERIISETDRDDEEVYHLAMLSLAHDAIFSIVDQYEQSLVNVNDDDERSDKVQMGDKVEKNDIDDSEE